MNNKPCKYRYLALPFAALLAVILLSCDKSKNTPTTSPSARFIEMELVGVLDKVAKETSGLALWGNTLITHNDRGNTNELFFISTATGVLEKTLTVQNATNTDWEDLAIDNEYLYINDAGNNDGDRRDLGIYKVPKTFSQGVAVTTERIAFTYPSQTQFTPNKNHNYDCEALIAFGDSLFFFTKNRGNNQTDLYRIPKIGGNFEAEWLANYNTECLITGAAIHANGKKIALCGIDNKKDVYLFLLSDFEGSAFFSGSVKKYYLGRFDVYGQVEAVEFVGDDLFLTAEKVKKYGLPPRLFRIGSEAFD
ncbi:MAG: hypothetical protein LAT76_01770 [Schleiferiaceae bacterium]|nr:hypothetical protein [Schleiferiaceae bacterium]